MRVLTDAAGCGRHGLAGVELYGRALLDTGNGAHTIITRSFAERLDLIDSAGLPRMLAGSARHVTARGVVAGAEEEQWVLPRVKFEIGGITLTSDMTVGADGGIEGDGGHGPDVLVSMGDIQALVAMGADFSPVRTMWNGRTGEYSS